MKPLKLSIPRKELLRGLARVQSLVEKRNTMPILANVLLQALAKGKEAGLELVATDLEVGVVSTHAALVDAPGATTVSAKKLFEVVRELPDEPVHLEASANSYLAVRCARAEFSLAGSAAEEYPALPAISPGQMVPIQALMLGQMIERTLYAASLDESRYNLNGVFLELLGDGEKLRMVATDGHRLAYVDRVFASRLDALPSGVIVPRKGLAELKRLVDEEDSDEIELGCAGNHMLARKGGVVLSIRLIEGEFPSYRQVLPAEVPHQLTISTERLSQSLRRISLLSAERSRAIHLELLPGLLRLTSSNPDLGQAQEELDVDYDGAELKISFNARYLLDCLAAMHGKETRISLKDGLSPAQLTPTDDPDTLAVVMPMRL